jgi:TonB family protein
LLSIVLSLAVAADIPVGARVIVPASIPITTPAGQPVLTTTTSWAARVVQDLGDRLVVEPEGNACQRTLSMYPELRLWVAIDESALQRLTTRALSGTGAAGEEWQVGAGVAVRDGLVDLGAVGRLKLPLPEEALGSWTTEALLPSTFLDGDRQVGPPRGPVMFLGQPLSPVDNLNIHQEKDRVYWKSGCGGVSFLMPSHVPFSEADGRIGGVLGGLGIFPMAKVAAGTTLRWPDGEEAGKTAKETTLQNFKQNGESWCGDFTLAGKKLKLCTTEVEEILTEPTSPSSASNSSIILGSLSKSDIDAVIRDNMKKISRCYRLGQASGANTLGKVTLKFVIGTDGQVTSAQVKNTTLNNPTTEACMVEVAQKMIFPPPSGGGVVIVSYPFSFSN